MGLDETMSISGCFHLKPRIILCMKNAIYLGKAETLAEYYVRVHGHLLRDVIVYEILDDKTICEIRNGLTV